MSGRKPTIVIVHGAWHVPAHFDSLSAALQRSGYAVRAPKLPSVGIEKDPGNALTLDREAVAKAIREVTDGGEDVVLVMHSYGGIPGSEGAAIIGEERKAVGSNYQDGARGSVVKLVYLSSFALDAGSSLISEPLAKLDTRPGLTSEISPLGIMTPNEQQAIDRIFTGTPTHLAKAAFSITDGQALSAFTEMTRYCGWRDYGYPVSYLGCKKDEALLPIMQEAFIERMKTAGLDPETAWLDCDHSPFLHMPEDLGRAIQRMAEHI
ncbi:hypothetical protein LTR85_000024 [Meristemomyces frigidus]|nr:hypothetical protein LTR85_000024 [Meristemomyces frigidus]